MRAPLAARPSTRATPMDPPITPPTACRPAHPRTPPHLAKAGATMKYVPMIRPATAADSTETLSSKIEVREAFLKYRSYLSGNVTASKTMLAAVNPKKNTPPGFNTKFMTVAISPTMLAAPGFRTHQTVNESTAKPITSQSIGNPNIWNTIGENIEFSTPHSAENKAITAISRLP